jgi:hypothetical protein
VNAAIVMGLCPTATGQRGTSPITTRVRQRIRGRVHPNDQSSGRRIARRRRLCPRVRIYADVSEKIVSRKPLGSLTSNARLFHSVS